MFPIRVKTVIIIQNSADFLVCVCMILPNLDLIPMIINRVLFGKLSNTMLDKKFTALYGILKLITVFTRAKNWLYLKPVEFNSYSHILFLLNPF